MFGRLKKLVSLFIGICIIGFLLWALGNPEGFGAAVGDGIRSLFEWIGSFFSGADVDTPDVDVNE